MTPLELSHTVLRAVRRAVDAGELWVEIPVRAPVTPPGPGGCGDYATPIALKLARPAGHPPLKVAEILRPHLAHEAGIRDVVITPPGFLNITLQETSLIQEILAKGPRYGHPDTPTAPLTHLHAPNEPRALVVMDTLARVLRSQGTPVHTSCDTRPTPELTSTLGIEIDTYGTPPAANALTIRPVPAPLPDTPPFFPLGRDATRWALLHPAPHDHPHLTGAHLTQRETNPLFRVRYGYARTRALTRNAAALGFTSMAPTLAPEPGVRAR
ncbi:arginyl-tRNA synthetase, partial [Streptomyces acidiscabies]